MKSDGKRIRRADRILDAAARLLRKLGYQKVTIDDIAQAAAIGKGTVYLHWPTKQRLVEALFLRESIAYVEGLMAALAHDPTLVQPHRLLAYSFLQVRRQPALRALLSGALPAMKGWLADSARRSLELVAVERFFAVMTRHGLLRSDIPNLSYTMSALHGGFYVLDAVDPRAARLSQQAKADSLSYVIRQACEPATPPEAATLQRAAAELLALFAPLLSHYQSLIYGEDLATTAKKTRPRTGKKGARDDHSP